MKNKTSTYGLLSFLEPSSGTNTSYQPSLIVFPFAMFTRNSSMQFFKLVLISCFTHLKSSFLQGLLPPANHYIILTKCLAGATLTSLEMIKNKGRNHLCDSKKGLLWISATATQNLRCRAIQIGDECTKPFASGIPQAVSY